MALALEARSGRPCPCRVRRVPRPGLTACSGLTVGGRGEGSLRAREVQVRRLVGHHMGGVADGLVHVAVAVRGRRWSWAVVRVPSGVASAVARLHDGCGLTVPGACCKVHACPWSAGSPCGWIKIEGLDCSCGWWGGPVSESLGFLGFWCIL